MLRWTAVGPGREWWPGMVRLQTLLPGKCLLGPRVLNPPRLLEHFWASLPLPIGHELMQEDKCIIIFQVKGTLKHDAEGGILEIRTWV